MTSWFIPQAMAAEAATGGMFPGADMLIILALALVFYFLIWRPQSKRSKDHRTLIAGLAVGDEVVSNGGLIGKITKIEEQYLLFEVAENIELRLQKNAVSAALPKGTIKSI